MSGLLLSAQVAFLPTGTVGMVASWSHMPPPTPTLTSLVGLPSMLHLYLPLQRLLCDRHQIHPQPKIRPLETSPQTPGRSTPYSHDVGVSPSEDLAQQQLIVSVVTG